MEYRSMTSCSYDSIAAGTTHSLFRVIVPPMLQHLQNGAINIFVYKSVCLYMQMFQHIWSSDYKGTGIYTYF